MPKIEVEHRGILTEKKFKELNRFFRKEGKFLDKKDRFSIIYFVSKKKVKRIEEMKNVPIDLKLRITNKKTELGLKYGKWGGKDARKEFLFPINSRKNKNFPILKKDLLIIFNKGKSRHLTELLDPKVYQSSAELRGRRGKKIRRIITCPNFIIQNAFAICLTLLRKCLIS